jgi:asparagine synthase (glutamine-hydrolysing)
MCGIAAVITEDSRGLERVIRRVTDRLYHRGPDEAGIVCRPESGVALGMRRLSIVDIDGGHQPMWDERQAHAVVFNGEIYNASNVRAELEALGHTFASDHSDTEVVVHGYEEWGSDVVGRLNGMFAFVVWERRANRLFVARDRFGEKPLYIAKIGGGYVVGSELKAVLEHPDVSRELDLVALEQFLAFDFIVSPRTILTSVEKLPAAHYAYISVRGVESRRYWSLPFRPDERLTLSEATERLDSALSDSVRTRMVADVPVGLFLSGGLDSTSVGYYMCRHSSQVHSFSIGFDDDAFDESRYASLAAQHLGTQHHSEVFSAEKAREVVPDIASVLDEPMADQSILPTYLLSAFARRHVKVALGGDGSDELLMGYKAYKGLKAAWSLDALPRGLRSGIARSARRLPARLGPVNLRGKTFAERLDQPPELRQLCALGAYGGSARWVLSRESEGALDNDPFISLAGSLLADRAAFDGPGRTIESYSRGYLQEDILVKVDRASMAVSLEVRAPFLDPDLSECLSGIPHRWKLRGLTGKYVLRQLMRGRVPDAIIDRPKQGFGVPVNAWMRGPLSPLVRDYLAPSRLSRDGIFNPQRVLKLVNAHMDGDPSVGNRVWSLLLFELWKERWLGADVPVGPSLMRAS